MYIYKQCKFRDFALEDDGENGYLGGIAIIEDYGKAQILQGVICGCCGSIIEPDDIAEIEYYDNWVDIEDCIRRDE